MHPEGITAFTAQALVMAPHRLQEVVGAVDVALDEHTRAGDGSVHVAFRCQVHHQIGVGLPHRSLNGCCIGQIHLLKPVPILCRFAQPAQHLLNRGQVAGIAHLVEIEDGDCGLPQQPAHDGAANEAGTSGDQNSAAISQQVGGGRHGRNHW